eukprot:COSAG06_NODE_2985_length_5985_cov_81.901121_1_plen_451_part_00
MKGVFFPAHPHITLVEDNAVAELTKSDGSWHTAASEATVSGGGLHAARFTVRKGRYMVFGAIRADWGVEGEESAHYVQGHCFYETFNGRRYPGNSEWGGMQGAREEGDRIDMLLDLGAGSMSVFKNGEPLGVMQESGLGGAGVEYRWAVVLGWEGDSARIDVMPAAEVEALVQVQARMAQREREREREREECEALVAQRERERLEREAQRERERPEREAQQKREREAQQERERVAQEAKRERERLAPLARSTREQDLGLPAGTRLRVQGHVSDGIYERWERRTFGANAHFIDFGDGVQQVALKGLRFSVLPPKVALPVVPRAVPVVTVRVVEITGTETEEIKDVSLGWSVSRLNATIAERRGVSAELQRLVVGDAALDDANALLSLCGVSEGTLIHVVPQEAGAAAARAAAAATAPGGVEEGQPPDVAQQPQDTKRARGGGWLCCASPAS